MRGHEIRTEKGARKGKEHLVGTVLMELMFALAFVGIIYGLYSYHTGAQEDFVTIIL
jgi:hypothetical protein